MEKALPNGIEVLIFKYLRGATKQDNYNYIKGIVKSSELSGNLSYHGSPWYEQIYTVLGEDGKKYVGCYGRGIVGGSYFRTPEDQIEFLQHERKMNEEEIKKINQENYEIDRKIINIRAEYQNKKRQDVVQAAANYIDSLNLSPEQREEFLKEYEEILRNSESGLKRTKKLENQGK